MSRDEAIPDAADMVELDGLRVVSSPQPSTDRDPAQAPSTDGTAEPDTNPIPIVGASSGRRDSRSVADDVVRVGAAEDPAARLLTSVERLRDEVATLPLVLDVQGVQDARHQRSDLIGQLDDYVLPRLRRRDAPLLAVIGGSTGAGKSTLTNSLIRREVSRSGVLRPTTRSPVLVHHPFDSGAFLSQRILPGLTRVTSEAPEPAQPIELHAPRVTGLRLVPHEALTPGLALIDAPDIDSLVETNRDLAVQLLAAGDLWIFVTTAARYADALPWQMLRQAAERGVSVAIVLDRVAPESLQELRIQLAGRLRERGLGSAPMFVIPETSLIDGFLPEAAVAPLLAWLRRIAGDPSSRALIAERTLSGALASLPSRVQAVATAADDQAHVNTWMHVSLQHVVAARSVELGRRLASGALLRGDVLSRWQELLADGELLRRLDTLHLPLADRLLASIRRQPVATYPLTSSISQAVTDALRAAVRVAAEEAAARWNEHPAGADLVERRAGMLAAGEVAAQLEQQVQAWSVGVTEIARSAVEAAGVDGVPTAPDVETAAGVLMLVALLDPAHPDVDQQAVDATAPAQRVLAAVIGADAAGTAEAAARSDLTARAAAMLDGERNRLERLLQPVDGLSGRGEALRIAARAVDGAR